MNLSHRDPGEDSNLGLYHCILQGSQILLGGSFSVDEQHHGEVGSTLEFCFHHHLVILSWQTHSQCKYSTSEHIHFDMLDFS